MGQSVTDSEGKHTVTYTSAEATVETACGTFYNCIEVQTRFPVGAYVTAPTFIAWYKRNIGLVAYAWQRDDGEIFGKTSVSAYTVNGGHGIIPFAEGNTWHYAIEGVENDVTLNVTVSAVQEDKAYLSYVFYAKGKPFDEGCWLDHLLYARNNYYTPMSEMGLDVSPSYDRAAALAVTPWEKKVTEVSRAVMDRIYRGDLKSHPDAKQQGRWNFFCYYDTKAENGRVTMEDNRTYAFEWKEMNKESQSMLHNFIYDILQNNLGGIWNDEWLAFADRDEEFTFRRPAKLNDGQEFVGYAGIRSGVTVETVAGRFEGCLHFRTHTSQNDAPGWAYMCSDKDYYFAPGIGLVRIVTYVTSYEDLRIYDLVSYKGEGEGYMPISAGMERHYRFLNDNEPRVHAGASYYYVEDNDGNLVILGDQTGMLDVTPQA